MDKIRIVEQKGENYKLKDLETGEVFWVNSVLFKKKYKKLVGEEVPKVVPQTAETESATTKEVTKPNESVEEKKTTVKPQVNHETAKEKLNLEINKVHQGDCIELLKKLPDNSVDAVVTDPPYGLEFMGKEWDKFEENSNWDNRNINEKSKSMNRKNAPIKQSLTYKAGLPFQQFSYSWAKEVFRVLKHGGFLLAFSGTRTYHRMVCGIEDAEFEIRDCISWLYGSGFPKSHNIGKAIDKLQGNERKVIGTSKNEKCFRDVGKRVKEIEGIDKLSFGLIENAKRRELEITKGNSEWEGWGTALKPACEPIVVARKPLSEKSVALNVLKWGCGGINIDDCRIETDEIISNHARSSESAVSKGIYGDSKGQETHQTEGQKQGRFPANILLSCFCGDMKLKKDIPLDIKKEIEDYYAKKT